MPIPDLIAKPIISALYPILRKQQNSPIPPIRRKIMSVNAERRAAFDALLDSALAGGPNTPISYTLSYPKADFLNYVCDWRGLVAHGSPLGDLNTLEPIRKSTDSGEFGNRKQIFASPDAMWALWFAILDKTKYSHTRNGCVRAGHGHGRVKFYHFELPRNVRTIPPFVSGTIYFARAEDFPDHRSEPALDILGGEVEEWGSIAPVTPLVRIPVSPQDFPYLDKVQFCL